MKELQLWAEIGSIDPRIAKDIGFLETGRCDWVRLGAVMCNEYNALPPHARISAAPMQKPPPFGRGFLA
ncbi:hypothetical protein HR51_39150 [Burkholderia cepacia]|nr:hypothetical protein HR51_39150 [Burkholderia cepacia]